MARYLSAAYVAYVHGQGMDYTRKKYADMPVRKFRCQAGDRGDERRGAKHVGAASGINNAASRIAGLLAVAVFGALLSGVFRGALQRRFDHLEVAPAAHEQIEAQQSKLAAAETGDVRGQQAIEKAIIAGYRAVLWIAVGLSLASSLSAAVLIRSERQSPPRRLRVNWS